MENENEINESWVDKDLKEIFNCLKPQWFDGEEGRSLLHTVKRLNLAKKTISSNNDRKENGR